MDDSNGSGGTLGTGLGLHSETVGYGASGLTRTLLRHEDSLLRPAGFQLKNVAVVDHATGYGYDTAGRPKYVDPSYPLPATPAFAYGYEDDSIGLLKTVTGPAHTVTNVWEPNRDVLDTKTNADRASTPVTVSAFNYGVNNLGQRTGVATSGSAFPGGYAIGWAYNPSGELKEEDFGANQTSETRDRAFQYDAIGNREKTANGLLADLPVSPNYTANSLNQYTVANGITLPTTPAAHDADGNAKAWNIRNPLATGSSSLAACTFTWDAENRLTEVRNSGGTVIATYAYDFQSRRIRKTVTGGEDVAFFYDGWNCIAEYQIGTSVPLARYTWGQDLSGSMQGAGGVGGLLVVTKSSTSYYPTFDGNGNVSEYLNSSGAGVVHFEYDAFGNVVNFTESGAGLAATFRHRFSTKPQDTETGLLYYGYRYYDPVTGRWPSRDPIEEEGGMNLYGFVKNNGVQRIDYLGLEEPKPKKPKPDESICCCIKEPEKCSIGIYFIEVKSDIRPKENIFRFSHVVGVRIEHTEGKDTSGFHLKQDTEGYSSVPPAQGEGIPGVTTLDEIIPGVYHWKTEGDYNSKQSTPEKNDYHGKGFIDRPNTGPHDPANENFAFGHWWQAHVYIEEAPTVDNWWGYAASVIVENDKAKWGHEWWIGKSAPFSPRPKHTDTGRVTRGPLPK